MCLCNEHKLSALQVWRPEQNAALNATADRAVHNSKIIRQSAKPGIEHTQCCVSVVHKYKNVRLRMKTVE